jgi:hypothetical protein
MCKVLLCLHFELGLAVPSPKPVQFPTFRGRELLSTRIAMSADRCRDGPVVPSIRYPATNAMSLFRVVWRPFWPVVETVTRNLEESSTSAFRHPSEWDFERLPGLADGRFRIGNSLRVFADIDEMDG